MRIAITGAAGFIGTHLARALLGIAAPNAGDGLAGPSPTRPTRGTDVELVLITRPGGAAKVPADLVEHKQVNIQPIGLDDANALGTVFNGCEAVVHVAGINRQIGKQTYQRVHVQGTRHIVAAAKAAGAKKLVLTSFLRARPNCDSGYHESKFAAEQIVRDSGLDYTILKCGVIYGQGDHMLDHLSHTLLTLPVFALVGMKDKPVRPTAVEDVIRIICAAVETNRLSRKMIAVVGPEQMLLGESVRRVAEVLGKRRLYVRLPLWFHYAFAQLAEKTMTVPIVSTAQVRILSEGVSEPAGECDQLPDDLRPARRFTALQIERGLPPRRRLGWRDCRCLARPAAP